MTNTVNFALLSAVMHATASPAGFLYVDPNAALPLATAGLIETNPNMVNEAGEIAARITEAGANAVNANAAATGFNSATTAADNSAPATPAPTTTAPAASSPFVRAMFVPPAKERKARVASEKYPFGDLIEPNKETGAADAFFVAASADMPDPVKSLASAVSAANRRYATVTGTEPVKDKDGNVAKDKDGKDKVRNVYKYNRKFEVFAGTADNTPTGQPGAWVARTM